jgi:hypothetical protein
VQLTPRTLGARKPTIVQPPQVRACKTTETEKRMTCHRQGQERCAGPDPPSEDRKPIAAG